MRFPKSYHSRWFFYSFCVGAFVPLFLFGSLICYTHLDAMIQLSSQGQPVAFVTNPFIELTDPVSGKVVASGAAALCLVAVACGLCGGILGLGIGFLKRFLRRDSSQNSA